MSNALTMLGRVLDGRPSMMVIPACCGIVTAGAYPTTSYGVPVISATFASAPAFASGVVAVARMNGDPINVFCWAGDGGTYDIGIATLSAAAERNEDIIYVCYDNEIYGNTGGQRSSATPYGARTSTTPSGKSERKKELVEIMAAHRIPYAATLSIAHREDFEKKIRTALEMKGFRFLLIHSPCPTGWKSEPSESVQLVRLAVQAGLFPLYEVFDGEKYHITVEPEWIDPSPYFEMQKRFDFNRLGIEEVKREAKRRFERLRRREGGK
jgi:pyruvate ferredoxin oxidoreductase beta subunit/2-oxoisovalerate ferredoxin oxidoreductase beta subunit